MICLVAREADRRQHVVGISIALAQDARVDIGPLLWVHLDHSALFTNFLLTTRFTIVFLLICKIYIASSSTIIIFREIRRV